MSALSYLKRHLRPGQVYRRKDLARWSNAVDRHVRQMADEGRLEKVSAGVYMAPRQTRFGAAPAKPEKLVGTFLGDDRFLMVSLNAFNGLGVGTTQLYNEPIVYNRKRYGKFTLDGRIYDFRMRPRCRSGYPRNAAGRSAAQSRSAGGRQIGIASARP
ncbi:MULTISPECIES: hypothetical protein [unclassified Sphingobium]|uniref:hypothetical protein n=1 Tax=unclassified Sphingobium TaxID=2611147 RepID=UPI0035A61A3A